MTTAGPAVIFLHGMRTSAKIWDAQVAHVRAHGYDTAAIDLPGHATRRHQQFTLEHAFDVIDDTLTTLQPGQPAVLVGLSLGGYVSLAYAARDASTATHRVAGLVAAACSTSPKGKPVSLFRHVSHATAATGRALRLTRRPQEDTARPGWGLVTDALDALAGTSTITQARAIKVPIWFVNGARDPMRLGELQHHAAADRSALVVINGAGHDVNTDQPARFNQVLDRALQAFTGTLALATA